nr:GMC family oxidoreductase N-terminal domain-containing protein [Agromyces bauzanensis]
MHGASTVQGAMPVHPANWSYLGHVRARPEDFARWAAAAGPEWSYERVLPVLRALEHDLDLGAGPHHGDAGPMPVRRASQANTAARAFTAAALELGFAPEADKNAPGAPGVGPVPQNVVDGVRVNTGIAYLNPVRDRPNLQVMGGCRVLRVVFDGTRAVGVEVEQAENGRASRSVIRADEVVPCAGGIGTPHLLLVSGIGPAEQSHRFDVPVVRDAPGVGRAFSDHPDLSVGWRSRRDVVDTSAPETFTTALNFSSPGGSPAGDLEIMVCVTTMGHLLTGVERGRRRCAFCAATSACDDAGAAWCVAAPGSRPGRARARPGAARRPAGRAGARLDHARVGRPDDSAPHRVPLPVGRARSRADAARHPHGRRPAALARLRRPVRSADTELDDATLDDDSALDAWMLTNLGTAIHLCGSAPMGPASDPNAVVDGYGSVHGVEGLRVADTSMLPDAPSRGPAATAVLIGEFIARFMRRSVYTALRLGCARPRSGRRLPRGALDVGGFHAQTHVRTPDGAFVGGSTACPVCSSPSPCTSASGANWVTVPSTTADPARRRESLSWGCRPTALPPPTLAATVVAHRVMLLFGQ